MGKRTKIQWCDDTVNPTMGCDGCELWSTTARTCYAGVLHQRFGGKSPGYAPAFEQVTLFPGRMAEAAGSSDLLGIGRPDKPWLWGLPRLVFVSDMSDALSAAVSFEYLEQEVVRIVSGKAGSRHLWLWLTKRPRRMAEFSGWLAGRGVRWPVNLWVGTSVTTRGTVGRVDDLLGVGDEDTVRFASVEPQIEAINLASRLPYLDWVIQGGESGADARPFDVEWARAMKRECEEAGVAFFLKQLGANAVEGGHRLGLRDRHGGDWSEWPADLGRRQMPRAARSYRPPTRGSRGTTVARAAEGRFSLCVID